MFLGADIQGRINLALAEPNTSQWIDLKGSFDYCYEAAKDFAKETNCWVQTQTIPTVANQAAYPLNPDFLEVLTKDDNNFGVVEYAIGSSVTWLNWESYNSYLQNNNPVGTPTDYAICAAPLNSRITGTVTTGSTFVGGETSLIDSNQALFGSLYPGDSVVDTTSGNYGFVIAAGTNPTTAMFSIAGRFSTYASWALTDTYMVQMQPRYQILLDPPPSATGQVLTVTYNAKPLPVYSDYGTYPFATGYEEAIIAYAAWKYRYRDSKPQLGDPLYAIYERYMRKAKNVHGKAAGKTGFRVNFIAPSSRSWTT